jgi:hypothetical protein
LHPFAISSQVTGYVVVTLATVVLLIYPVAYRIQSRRVPFAEGIAEVEFTVPVIVCNGPEAEVYVIARVLNLEDRSVKDSNTL